MTIRQRETAAMAPSLTAADHRQYVRDASILAHAHLHWRERVAWGMTSELAAERAELDAEIERMVARRRQLEAAGFSCILAWPDRPETLQ